MEYITQKLETIIEDILLEDELDIDEIVQILNNLKDEIEEIELKKREEQDLQWDDLD
jgi:hypothetical protein